MRRWVVAVPVLGAAVLAVAFLSYRSADPGSGSVQTTEERRARGKYLVTAMGCNDCHTPFHLGPNGPEPDMSRMLSGHPEAVVMPPPPQLPEGPWGWVGAVTNTAFAGPWGVSFAFNLTPDPSGLSAWDEDIFIRAIRSGKHFGASRDILPPMPWPMIRQLTDDDLKSVFAYLQSIPPVRNHVPDPVPPAIATVASVESGS